MIIHNRKQLRLKDYNYSQSGYYFITICAEDKKCIFGNIVGEDSISSLPKMILNDFGSKVINIFLNLSNYNNIILHDYILMPNHFHCIIELDNENDISKNNLSYIIQSFKRHTTLEYIKGVKNNIYEKFESKIWQRGFYEHIIRDNNDLIRIKEYIINNSIKWLEDQYYLK